MYNLAASDDMKYFALSLTLRRQDNYAYNRQRNSKNDETYEF